MAPQEALALLAMELVTELGPGDLIESDVALITSQLNSAFGDLYGEEDPEDGRLWSILTNQMDKVRAERRESMKRASKRG